MNPLLLQTIAIAAGWDAWLWYFTRVSSTSEMLLLLALFALLGIMAVTHPWSRAGGLESPLLPVTLLLGLYAASHAVAPPIIRCTIAVMAALAPTAYAAFRKPPPIAFWGIVILTMPILPSLHFTADYPMRVASAMLSIAVMQMHGFDIVREGTFLLWQGARVQFDAPCSGVNMLWAGLLLTLTGCLLFRLSAARLLLALMLSVAMTLISNALRATALFYMEVGLLPAGQPWWHEGVGIVSFTLCAATTLWLTVQLGPKETRPCQN